jgi:hypothetical protein
MRIGGHAAKQLVNQAIKLDIRNQMGRLLQTQPSAQHSNKGF